MAKQFLSGEQAGILVHAIADRLDEVASAAGSTKPTDILIPITYPELVSLRNSSKLYPGATYRITDYRCSSSDANTAVASNKFDILVKAIDTNNLSEHCNALRNASDTYFPTETDFDAWEVWYCLDNDTTRFGWASTSGKGVIYRLIDEFGNDCPYDFKNIMFKRTTEWFSKHESWSENVLGSIPTSGKQYFTFSIVDANLNGTDLSINYHNGQKYLKFYQNKIAPYYSDGVQKLNNNVFVLSSIDDTGCHSNTFGIGCTSNTFGIGCTSNTFGNGCTSNTFGNSCGSNTFGVGCSNNTFWSSCISNTFGNSCSHNTFRVNCSNNTFGNGCGSNTFETQCATNFFGNSCAYNNFGAKCSTNFFGNGCYSNTFGSGSGFNTFGNDTSSNTFGVKCVSNTFGNSCISNTFGDKCGSNTFGNNSRSNKFGNSCTYNFFGNYCGSNAFGANCSYNTFGSDSGGNKFGSGCSYNTFGNSCFDNIFGKGTTTLQSYCRYNCFEDGVQHIFFYTSQTTSSTSFLQNITIHRGVKGSQNGALTITVPDVNKNYNREYGRNASGTLVNWVAK